MLSWEINYTIVAQYEGIEAIFLLSEPFGSHVWEIIK